MLELTEPQREFVHRLAAKYHIIEVRLETKQWRINHVFLAMMEVMMQDKDAYDSITRSVEISCKDATHEEKIVLTSFVMEFVVENFKNIHLPEVLDTDIKDSRELIDYLIEEEKKTTAK